MTLPVYEVCQQRVVDGTNSALDWFLVEWEPPDEHAFKQRKFRAELEDLVRECAQRGWSAGGIVRGGLSASQSRELVEAAVLIGNLNKWLLAACAVLMVTCVVLVLF